MVCTRRVVTKDENANIGILSTDNAHEYYDTISPSYQTEGLCLPTKGVTVLQSLASSD